MVGRKNKFFRLWTFGQVVKHSVINNRNTGCIQFRLTGFGKVLVGLLAEFCETLNKIEPLFM